MDHALRLIAEKLSIGRFKLSGHSGVIFLCGGPMVDDGLDPQSARDFLHRKISRLEPELADRIFLAEEINSWYQDMLRADYTPDLLTFEQHLSGLSSAICLIVESPGSIAELGAFSVVREISARLMVAIRRKYEAESSFISLGPIDFLKKQHPTRNHVFVYPWRLRWSEALELSVPVLEDLEAMSADFVQDLKDFEQSIPKVVKFNKELDGHVSLLIAELVWMFSALKIRELADVLGGIGLILEEKDIKGHLFLLEKLGLTKTYPYRGSPYYVALNRNDFIDYNISHNPGVINY